MSLLSRSVNGIKLNMAGWWGRKAFAAGSGLLCGFVGSLRTLGRVRMVFIGIWLDDCKLSGVWSGIEHSAHQGKT
jgi:hypothetical protein